MAFSGILGAGLSLASGLLGRSSAKKAQKMALRNQAKALALQKQQLKMVTPFVERGDAAGDELSIALGLEGQDAQQEFFDNFEFDPGFQAALGAGLDQVEGRLNAGGLTNSGRRLAEVGQFVTDRTLHGAFADRLNRLSSLSTQGLQGAQLSGQATNSAANTLTNMGQTAATGEIAGTNALIKGLQGVGNSLSFAGGFGGNMPSNSSGFQTTTTPTLRGLPNFISNQFA